MRVLNVECPMSYVADQYSILNTVQYIADVVPASVPSHQVELGRTHARHDDCGPLASPSDQIQFRPQPASQHADAYVDSEINTDRASSECVPTCTVSPVRHRMVTRRRLYVLHLRPMLYRRSAVPVASRLDQPTERSDPPCRRREWRWSLSRI